MADLADRAQLYEQSALDELMTAREMSWSQAPTESAWFCAKCGFPIPEPRRRAVPGS
jgi:RNA polymerase-binding transcription factor DksA